MSYRPIRGMRGFKSSTVSELITFVEKYLYDFAQTDSFDSGHRLSEVEAYLQGIVDAKYIMKNGKGL